LEYFFLAGHVNLILPLTTPTGGIFNETVLRI
jgi:hypothetical protein